MWGRNIECLPPVHHLLGIKPATGYVAQPETEPGTSCCMGQCWTNWATPARADHIFFCGCWELMVYGQGTWKLWKCKVNLAWKFSFNLRLKISGPFEETKVLVKVQRSGAIKAAGWEKEALCDCRKCDSMKGACGFKILCKRQSALFSC